MKIVSIRAAVLSVALLGGCAVAAASPAGAAAARHAVPSSGNIMVNAGAEHTGRRPTANGDKVPVTGWTVAKRYKFTAVRYGTSGFPTRTSPGPKARGRNFFAGGITGTHSVATQTESLAKWRPWIKNGHARFALAAWLGGFETQNDNTTLTVTWQTKTGKALGSASIGPVRSNARRGVTGLLRRKTSGRVPRGAVKALVRLSMKRTDGTYNDGYADNLSLVLTKS
jgi:hypothetical protein